MNKRIIIKEAQFLLRKHIENGIAERPRMNENMIVTTKNHCRGGREGSRLLSGSCLYLGEGDLSMHTMDNCAPEMTFPLKHYRGISVVINLKILSSNLPEILSESGIDLMEFKEKFCADGNALLCGQKMKLTIFFQNFILYRIACKSLILS